MSSGPKALVDRLTARFTKPKQSRVDRFVSRNFLTPERFFVITALVFGIPMLLFRPAYDVPDFGVHLTRSYGISEGHIVPRTKNVATLYQPQNYRRDLKYVGERVPYGIARLTTVSIPYYHDNYEKIAPKDQFKLYTAPNSPRMINTQSNTASVYNPLGYAVQAIGFLLSRMVGLSYYGSILFVSTLNFVLWLLMIRRAIKVTAVGKWVIVALNLLPITLFLTTSIITESLLFGTIFLFFAYLTKYLKSETKLTLRSVLPIIALALVLSVLKQTYVVLALLIVLLHKRFAISKDRWLAYVGGIGAPLFMTLVWGLVVHRMGVIKPVFAGGHSQLHYLATQPLHVAGVYINTIFSNYFDGVVWSFFGVLGRLSLALPLTCVVLLAGSLVVATGIETERFTLKRWQKIGLLAVIVLNVVLIFTSLFLYWTDIGSTFVNGLQGRYFIPLAILPVPLLGFIRFGVDNHKKAILTLEAILILCLFIASLLMIRRYYPGWHVGWITFTKF